MAVVVLGAGAVGDRHGLVSQQGRARGDGRRAAGRSGARDELGQWRRHPRERGRALVAARNAAEDPEVARPGERAAAPALRRDSAHVALGSRLRAELHAGEVRRQFARQSGACPLFAALAAGDRRRDRHRLRPRDATASRRSTARRNRSTLPTRACDVLAKTGLRYERIDVARSRGDRAGARRHRPHPGGRAVLRARRGGRLQQVHARPGGGVRGARRALPLFDDGRTAIEASQGQGRPAVDDQRRPHSRPTTSSLRSGASPHRCSPSLASACRSTR